MCEIDLGDTASLDSTTPRAKKDYQCAGCSTWIRPGETLSPHVSYLRGRRVDDEHCAACERDLRLSPRPTRIKSHTRPH